MSADVGRMHRIVHVADTGHEQGGGTQLLTVGAVRQRARAARTTSAQSCSTGAARTWQVGSWSRFSPQ